MGNSFSRIGELLPHSTLIDAEFRNKQSRGVFGVPKRGELERIRVGDFVKIGVEFIECPKIRVNGERFWVRVIKIIPEMRQYLGVIDNDLVFTHKHGLSADEGVLFQDKHILEVRFAK